MSRPKDIYISSLKSHLEKAEMEKKINRATFYKAVRRDYMIIIAEMIASILSNIVLGNIDIADDEYNRLKELITKEYYAKLGADEVRRKLIRIAQKRKQMRLIVVIDNDKLKENATTGLTSPSLPRGFTKAKIRNVIITEGADGGG
jgi:hypothetical protein